MTLQVFIESVGVTNLARKMNLSKGTVSKWKRLVAAPRPLEAQALIEISVGLLSFESIYKPYIKEQLKQKKT